MALSLVWLRRVPLVNSRRVRCPKIFLALAPIAQSAEAVDLKSIQCGFESHWGHRVKSRDIVPMVSRDFVLVSLHSLYAETVRKTFSYMERLRNFIGRCLVEQDEIAKLHLS